METNCKSRRAQRVAAAAFTLSLGVMWFGVGNAIADQGFSAPTQDGTLTVHKHVENPESTEGQPKGDPLKGVEFTISQVGAGSGDSCEALTLDTPAAWESINTLVKEFKGQLPAGYCEVADTAVAKTTAGDGTAKWENLRGIYLVRETKSGPNLISQAAAPFLVSVPMPVSTTDPASDYWNYDVHAYPKNKLTDFTPKKTVADNNEGTKLVPGAIVPWTITVPVPVAPFDYSDLVITDKPAAGLTLTEVSSVKVDDVVLTVGDDYTVDLGEGTVTLTANGLKKVNAKVVGASAKEATVTTVIKTTVNSDIDLGKFENSADVTLNGKKKPVEKPSTLWGKLTLNKFDKANQKKLQGAHFVVYEPAADGQCAPYTEETTAIVAEGDTNEDGLWSHVLWIANVQANDTSVKTKDYCVAETKAPAGYVLDTEPVKATLKSDSVEALTVDFPNVMPERPDLPLTGAQGTLAMAAIGTGLMGAGVAIIAFKRRQEKQAA